MFSSFLAKRFAPLPLRYRSQEWGDPRSNKGSILAGIVFSYLKRTNTSSIHYIYNRQEALKLRSVVLGPPDGMFMEKEQPRPPNTPSFPTCRRTRPHISLNVQARWKSIQTTTTFVFFRQVFQMVVGGSNLAHAASLIGNGGRICNRPVVAVRP